MCNYDIRRYRDARKKGICAFCFKRPAVGGFVGCKVCMEKRRARQRIYNQAKKGIVGLSGNHESKLDRTLGLKKAQAILENIDRLRQWVYNQENKHKRE